MSKFVRKRRTVSMELSIISEENSSFESVESFDKSSIPDNILLDLYINHNRASLNGEEKDPEKYEDSSSSDENYFDLGASTDDIIDELAVDSEVALLTFGEKEDLNIIESNSENLKEIFQETVASDDESVGKPFPKVETFNVSGFDHVQHATKTSATKDVEPKLERRFSEPVGKTITTPEEVSEIVDIVQRNSVRIRRKLSSDSVLTSSRTQDKDPPTIPPKPKHLVLKKVDTHRPEPELYQKPKVIENVPRISLETNTNSHASQTSYSKTLEDANSVDQDISSDTVDRCPSLGDVLRNDDVISGDLPVFKKCNVKENVEPALETRSERSKIYESMAEKSVLPSPNETAFQKSTEASINFQTKITYNSCAPILYSGPIESQIVRQKSNSMSLVKEGFQKNSF